MIIVPGEITEIVGRPSSGRTSVFMACLREITCGAGLAAVVDTDDVFDPASATKAGVELARTLWVRCGHRRDTAVRATDLLVRCPGFAVIGLDTGETCPPLALAMAYRLKLAVRRAGAALVIVGGRRVAGACAALVIEVTQHGVEWSGPGAVSTRLARVGASLAVQRVRSGEARAHARPGFLRMEWLYA